MSNGSLLHVCAAAFAGIVTGIVVATAIIAVAATLLLPLAIARCRCAHVFSLRICYLLFSFTVAMSC